MSKVIVPGPPNKPDTVPEKNTCWLQLEIKDPITGAVVPGSQVISAQLTIKNAATDAVIHNEPDVSSSFDQSTGLFRYQVSAIVNSIIEGTVNSEYEDHIAILVAQYNTGSGTVDVVRTILIRVTQQDFIS